MVVVIVLAAMADTIGMLIAALMLSIVKKFFLAIMATEVEIFSHYVICLN